MITAKMRLYEYYTFGAVNAYGQPQLSAEPQGTIKMAIAVTSQSIQDNINYKNANYIALTFDRAVDDTFVIQYGTQKLKVLYTTKEGRYTQVFLANYE